MQTINMTDTLATSFTATSERDFKETKAEMIEKKNSLIDELMDV